MPAPAHWLQVVLRGPNAALPACSGRDGALAWTYDTSTLYTSYSGAWLSVGGGGGSVDIYAGTGITCSPNPITGSGTVSLAVPVTIAHGGTNSTTALNNQQIMVSQSGMIVEAGAMTQGQLLIGKSGGQPVLSTLTAGAGIGIANGGGSITISNLSGTQQLLTSGFYGAASVTSGVLGSGSFNVVAGTGITVSQTAANVFTVTNASGTQQVLTSGFYGAASVTSGVLGSGAYSILAGAGITVSQTAANVFTVVNASGTQQTLTSGFLGSGAYNILAGAGITVSQTADNVFTVTNASGGGGGGTGTVTNVGTGTGLTGGSITSSGVISLSTPVSVTNGGTGDTSFTNTNQPILAGTTSSGALQSVTAGTRGQALTSTGTTAPTFQTAVVPGYVYGLNLTYASTTTFTVGTGYATDSQSEVCINNSSVPTITATSTGTDGLDVSTISSTVSTSSSTATITGAAGNTFLSSFPVIAMTGTISSSSTTVTGTNTLFLSQLAIGDLIGNTTTGFTRVTAIASNTSCTTQTSGGFSAGSACYRLENAWVQVNSQTVRQINAITSNTSITISANSSATVASGGTLYFGALPSGQVPLNVFIGQTTTPSTVVWLSTQRTNALSIGSLAYLRRIGSVIWTGSAINQFEQMSNGVDRSYNIVPYTVLSSGSSNATYTDVACNSAAPPSATSLFIESSIQAPSSPSSLGISSRTLKGGSGGVFTTWANTGLTSNAPGLIGCDGAQYIQFITEGAAGYAFLLVYGYIESL